ncbi:alpha/beta-hydrolase [Fomes fomentarius]|nr:alpha/beta-hydrolase [Fomes fomentarius]
MLVTIALTSLLFFTGQRSRVHAAVTPPNSFPHAWSGQPKGAFGPDWQSYFEVEYPLPGLHLKGPALPRSYAGNIPVDRHGHPNNTLFFWAFEREGADGGTLTAPANSSNTEPWIIWLQGGPGSSSMRGLFTENGPIEVMSNGSWIINPFGWHTLADTIWIDQPVGTGFSTADAKGYAADEDQVAEDFLGFLRNLVSVFPSLSTRPLYLTGESYAGTYIPYIAKHLFGQTNPPVNLRKVTIGDGFLGTLGTVRELPVLNIIETYPAIVGYDHDVFNYFREQHHLCGYDLNLTYPQTGGVFPTLTLRKPSKAASRGSVSAASWREAISAEYTARALNAPAEKRADFHERRAVEREQWKRDLSQRANGTLDPWYGCDLFTEMVDYALNFTFPWTDGSFDVYDVPDATRPQPQQKPGPFLNSAKGRAALHAPTSKDWSISFEYPFGSVYNKSIGGNSHGDPSVEPTAFLTELFTNASSSPNNVTFVFYSGNDDPRAQHQHHLRGIQGFSRKPSTPWFDDAGQPAGIVHQERGLAYVLFTGAGHFVPLWKPAQALTFLREFVLGDNQNGSVLDDGTIFGGEEDALAKDFLPGGNEIFYGSAKTEGTFVVPSATAAAWESFIATATLDSDAVATSTRPTGAGQRGTTAAPVWCLLTVGLATVWLFL